MTEHTAQQSIRDASGWGGGNGVNPLLWGTRPSAGRPLAERPDRLHLRSALPLAAAGKVNLTLLRETLLDESLDII